MPFLLSIDILQHTNFREDIHTEKELLEFARKQKSMTQYYFCRQKDKKGNDELIIAYYKMRQEKITLESRVLPAQMVKTKFKNNIEKIENAFRTLVVFGAEGTLFEDAKLQVAKNPGNMREILVFLARQEEILMGIFSQHPEAGYVEKAVGKLILAGDARDYFNKICIKATQISPDGMVRRILEENEADEDADPIIDIIAIYIVNNEQACCANPPNFPRPDYIINVDATQKYLSLICDKLHVPLTFDVKPDVLPRGKFKEKPRVEPKVEPQSPPFMKPPEGFKLEWKNSPGSQPESPSQFSNIFHSSPMTRKRKQEEEIKKEVKKVEKTPQKRVRFNMPVGD